MHPKCEIIFSPRTNCLFFTALAILDFSLLFPIYLCSSNFAIVKVVALKLVAFCVVLWSFCSSHYRKWDSYRSLERSKKLRKSYRYRNIGKMNNVIGTKINSRQFGCINIFSSTVMDYIYICVNIPDFCC